MKRLLPIFILLLFLAASFSLYAQCTGSNSTSLNWDYLRFFPSAGIGTYTSLATSQKQKFAFGTSYLTIQHNYTGSNAAGEDNLHTGETGSFGAGADVHFTGTGLLTFTFETPVTNVRFSLYDVDYKQKTTIASGAGNTVTLAKVSGSILSFSGNGSSSAQVTAASTAVAATSTDGTVNVTISGTVSSFTVQVTQTATQNASQEYGDYWLSDISACTTTSFPPNYYAVSKPFTGQPSYVLVARNNEMYYVNPATGAANLLFSDAEHPYFNSVAYDPVKRYVYYTFTRSGPGGAIDPLDKTIKRYDYDMDTLGVFIPDITSLVPVFEVGVESAAAAFYDGSLYLGIEASNSGGNKSIVWKIDMDSKDSAIAASQVFAIAGSTHDWADIGIAAGMLYDFDGRSSTYYHQNLLTHAVTSYAASGQIPHQTSVEWNNTLYNVGANSTGSAGLLTPYQLNGAVNTSLQKTITLNGTTVIGDWGDAGEAFKPKADFGDAPATYDPSTGDPAVHIVSSNLHLGTNADNEWESRGHSVYANSDNYDDGMLGGVIINPSSGNFFVQVKYVNKTGLPATVAAWVDFNNNGVFDAAEGIAQTNLPSSASTQTAYLNWTGIVSSLTNGSTTYIRLRITTTANGMTAANPTGYYNIGEVEDYWLPVVTSPLAAELVSFNVVKKEGQVAMDWRIANEERNTVYTLQRSADARAWDDLLQRKPVTNSFSLANSSADAFYNYIDTAPLKGVSYYRLKMKTRTETLSPIKRVEREEHFSIHLFPNPATDKLTLVVTAGSPTIAKIVLNNANGQPVHTQDASVQIGYNAIGIEGIRYLPNGLYFVCIQLGEETYSQSVIMRK